MQDLGKSMKKLMAKMLVETGECPDCGEAMLMWREPEGKNPRCPPVCMACGFRMQEKANDDLALSLEMKSRKASAYNYFKNNSLIRDQSLLRCKFDTYHADGVEQALAIDICKKTAEKIAHGQNMVIALAGNVGAGKSHLAISVLYDVIEKSNYKSKCLFVDYAAYLNELKFAMDDKEVRESIRKTLNKEIEKADVVVLDDIGAEIGGGREKATPFNIETLNNLLNCRKGKSLIYTTNLTGNDISKYYDERVQSRLVDFRNSEFITFKQTKDHRKIARAI